MRSWRATPARARLVRGVRHRRAEQQRRLLRGSGAWWMDEVGCFGRWHVMAGQHSCGAKRRRERGIVQPYGSGTGRRRDKLMRVAGRSH